MSHNYLLTVVEVSRQGQPEVADIYVGCRMSLVPLRSGLCVTSRLTAKTQRKVMQMINKNHSMALGIAGGHQGQLIVFYSGGRTPTGPLCSRVAFRETSH